MNWAQWGEQMGFVVLGWAIVMVIIYVTWRRIK
jgi:hypothetical protein